MPCERIVRVGAEESYHRHRRLLRARRERQGDGRATEQRYKLAASHCPMPPVLPTERIAHLGTADCCIHPPGPNEMIAITPPIIFSKEVAQNRPPYFPAGARSIEDQMSSLGRPWLRSEGEREIGAINPRPRPNAPGNSPKILLAIGVSSPK